MPNGHYSGRRLYRTINLRTLHFKYLFNKYLYGGRKRLGRDADPSLHSSAEV
jgi:hypothetical protein